LFTKQSPLAFARALSLPRQLNLIFRRDEGAAYCIRFSRFFKREAALWNPVLFILFLSAKLLYGFLCFFKREAALWNPVVFKREAALWIPVFLSAKLLYGFLWFLFFFNL